MERGSRTVAAMPTVRLVDQQRPAPRPSGRPALHLAPGVAECGRRRVGYYYGFANEGLWPLCHIAHTRPLFRASDWEHYKKVNQKFADAALKEMAGT